MARTIKLIKTNSTHKLFSMKIKPNLKKGHVKSSRNQKQNSKNDHNVGKKTQKKPKIIRSNLKSDLSSSQFRWVNEKLYTTDSETSKNMFKTDPSLFDIYHKGYTEQVKQWPINPVEHIIKMLQTK